jgi:phosphoserine aminotransferase
MLCVEDILDAMKWARSIGGAKTLVQRTLANYGAIKDWVDTASWIDFLAADPAYRSPTSVCLKSADPLITALSKDDQAAFFKKLTGMLAAEKVAYDIASYRDAPPGLRIWCGATVEADDLKALTAWIDWAYGLCRADLQKAA